MDYGLSNRAVKVSMFLSTGCDFVRVLSIFIDPFPEWLRYRKNFGSLPRHGRHIAGKIVLMPVDSWQSIPTNYNHVS